MCVAHATIQLLTVTRSAPPLFGRFAERPFALWERVRKRARGALSAGRPFHARGGKPAHRGRGTGICRNPADFDGNAFRFTDAFHGKRYSVIVALEHSELLRGTKFPA